MYYSHFSHPKESHHAQVAREEKERALGLPDQSLMRVGLHTDETIKTNLPDNMTSSDQ